ncbi:MAG: hypothetical protein A3F11_08940 [Gammaproteobacteria bacterium RIFCSPHIGHO2_12_FULL_37_14]|nr:MAG: hypothetical protein A3F11_08940 [Gammaproteobacteria bacterium RIFCSPHIGHO2_12_FULL_37_14]
MKNNSPITHQKIIFLIVFFCSALITSLFVYHLRHPSSPTTLPDDTGLIFPIARDIKPFKLTTADNHAFTEQGFRHHWTLLFFGFTHCSTICPTTLDMLKSAYIKLQPIYPDLQVVLISLDPSRDNANTLLAYTRSFHPDFIGATGQIQEIRKLQSQLGIFSTQDNSDTSYQIQHTASILLINPQGKWAGLFKSGMNPEQFSKAFVESIRILG